jgi:hypothetical protein
MENQTELRIITGMFLLIISIGFMSSILVDADYTTIYPGESGEIRIEVENNENFDIERVSVALILEELPFTSVGSSEKDLDNLDTDDDDSASFTLRASTDIIPGDYNIPYIVKYVNESNNSIIFEKTGTFGLRVSARTDVDFSVEVRENAIVGQKGRVSLEIINKGLGEIKSVSVQIFPQGFELLSKDKIFVGTIGADDSDTATFEVVYKTSSPTLSARVDYKDFDNNGQTEVVNLPVNVYTREQALSLGLIQNPDYTIYIVLGVLVVAFFIYRRIRKKRKNRKG